MLPEVPILDLETVRGGILDWLFKSVTTPDDPFHGINIGTRYRRNRLIEQAERACAEDVDYEGCMRRSGVRGPGF